MSERTTGAQDVPERPARDDAATPAESSPPRERSDTRQIGTVTAEPGARRTSNVEMLVIEAQLVADGHEPDNPAVPVAGSGAAEEFHERVEGTELEPAWMRPWQDGGDGA
jgi:hypothetical protein